MFIGRIRWSYYPPPLLSLHMHNFFLYNDIDFFSYLYVQVGLASVGKDTIKTWRSLRELDNHGTYRFFMWSPQLAVELHHLRGVENFYSAQGSNMIVSPSVIVCIW